MALVNVLFISDCFVLCYGLVFINTILLCEVCVKVVGYPSPARLVLSQKQVLGYLNSSAGYSKDVCYVLLR